MIPLIEVNINGIREINNQSLERGPIYNILKFFLVYFPDLTASHIESHRQLWTSALDTFYTTKATVYDDTTAEVALTNILGLH
jgi:hypothetical protein